MTKVLFVDDEKAFLDALTRRVEKRGIEPKTAYSGEEALTSLLAPIERVTGFDTVMPLAQLEEYYLPDHRRVLAGARKVLAA